MCNQAITLKTERRLFLLCFSAKERPNQPNANPSTED
jgi:hypothetical protein